MRQHNYFVYLLTNQYKTVLYVGVTNDLSARLAEHKESINPLSFTGKYKCYYLVYYERYQYVDHAIEREKEIKGWTRDKKNALIATENREWRFLDNDIME